MKDTVNRISRRLPEGLRNSEFWTTACEGIQHFDPELKKELKRWAAKYHAQFPELAEKDIRRDMLREYVRHSANPSQYYVFQLYRKSASARKEYIFTGERRHFFARGPWNVFPKDKYERYLLFKSVYRRDVTVIRSGEGEAADAFAAFRAKHDRFVAKPIDGTKGKGVCILSAQDVPTAQELLCLMGGPCLLEEVIRQGSELAAFHPSSVNTLRLVTAIADSGEACLAFALFRAGRGGSIVDNVGSGGIVAQVDLSTGVIISDGLCGDEWFEVHPDSKVRFKGTQIPDWETVCSIAKDAHKGLAEQRLIGWDFAWTDIGWDVVEVNPSPAFQSIQVLMGRGLRPELEQIFGVLKR